MADYREDWCLWCGCELPRQRHWRKIYCSDACRRDAINRMTVMRRQAANLTPRDCKNCGTSFTPKRRRNARFCSTSCAGRWSKRKERAALRAAQPERPCAECGILFRPSGRPGEPGLYCGKICAMRAVGRKHGYGSKTAG